MRIENEAAFVLHTRPWRETSLLVEVLTEHHGRLGLLARGLQGSKSHVLRAALQSMQSIRFSAVLRGELAQLRLAEAQDAAPRLSGEAMLAGFYVNELVLRLAPRQDPIPEIYQAYAQVRARLTAVEPLAWTLRRFERDLLQALGFGFDLWHDLDGQVLDSAARYRLDPLEGARRLHRDRGATDRRDAPTGRALLALAADVMPTTADVADLRRAMRIVLLHHLGGRGLKSWEMLEDLLRHNRHVRADPSPASRD